MGTITVEMLGYLRLLVIELLKSDDLDSAINILGMVIKEYPDDPACNNYMGAVLFRRGDNVGALDFFRKASFLDQSNSEYFNNWLNIFKMSNSHFPWVKGEVFDHANQMVVKRYFPPPLRHRYVYCIEISGGCQLRCPSCPVGNFGDANRPKGMMKIDLFKEILEKIQKEKIVDRPIVWLYNWGEPTLHPKLPEILKLLREFGLESWISSNLSVERDWVDIVRAEPGLFKISLSGYTQDVYEKSHKNGNINLVKSNMHKIRYLIDKYKVGTKVVVEYHMYKHNVHEEPEIRKLCSELGFSYGAISAHYSSTESMIRLLDVGVETAPSEKEFLSDYLIDPRELVALRKKYADKTLDCELRFNMTTINFDGSVALCCGVYDYENMLGVNFLDASHEEIESMKYKHLFCKKCYSDSMNMSPMPIEFEQCESAMLKAALESVR